MSLKLIIVTGNIGCGKTTTLRQIQTWVEEKGINEHVSIIFEAVDEWNFYLKKFYNTFRTKNAPRQNEYGFLLQMEILSHYHRVTRQVQQLQDRCIETGVDHYVFVERSPFDAKEVFIDTNKSLYTPEQYDLLAGFVAQYTALWMWNDATYIQIVAPKEECYRRISQRDRGGENKISLAYLTQLEEAYRKLADYIDMKTLSVSVRETPEHVAHSIWNLANVDERLFSD